MSGICRRITASLYLTCLIHCCAASWRKRSEEDFCPGGCKCDEPNSVECESLDFSRIPSGWPSSLEKILLRNCSIVTVEKNAFRKFHELAEIRIDKCPNLDVIDKFAFKGLKRLRSISITGNPNLNELYKNSFAAIGNDHPLRIVIKGNGIERIRSHAFRNAHDLREVTIEDHCFEVEANAFAGVEKVDFLNIKGACALEAYSFHNASRIYNLKIADSSLDIVRDTFARIYHVNQVQLNENRIGKIEAEAFGGMFTVGSVHLQSNQIGRIEERAFVGVENLGSLTLSYNTIRSALESPDCLLNDAQRFAFAENNLYCTCEMRWIQLHYKDQSLLSENYCGREESFKALSYYKPLGCPPLASFVSAISSTPPLLPITTPSPPEEKQLGTMMEAVRGRDTTFSKLGNAGVSERVPNWTPLSSLLLSAITFALGYLFHTILP